MESGFYLRTTVDVDDWDRILFSGRALFRIECTLLGVNALVE